MDKFDLAVTYVLQNEGGLNVNPHDSGKITNLGVSLKLLKSLSPEVLQQAGLHSDYLEEQILSLTPAQAKIIYKVVFWDNAPFDKIQRQEVLNFIFDMAVNEGISPAIKCLQRACWAVIGKWELLVDDGILGAHTISAVHQSGMFLLPALRAERGAYYRATIVTNPDKKEFINGWYNRTYNT